MNSIFRCFAFASLAFSAGCTSHYNMFVAEPDRRDTVLARHVVNAMICEFAQAKVDAEDWAGNQEQQRLIEIREAVRLFNEDLKKKGAIDLAARPAGDDSISGETLKTEKSSLVKKPLTVNEIRALDKVDTEKVTQLIARYRSDFLKHTLLANKDYDVTATFDLKLVERTGFDGRATLVIPVLGDQWSVAGNFNPSSKATTAMQFQFKFNTGELTGAVCSNPGEAGGETAQDKEDERVRIPSDLGLSAWWAQLGTLSEDGAVARVIDKKKISVASYKVDFEVATGGSVGPAFRADSSGPIVRTASANSSGSRTVTHSLRLSAQETGKGERSSLDVSHELFLLETAISDANLSN